MSKRWDVCYAYLDPTLGTEQAGNRPVLILSIDEFNEPLQRVTVLPITTRRSGRHVYPNEALLPSGTAGLDRESIAMGHQIRALSAARLKRRLGSVTDPAIQEACLRAVRVHLGMF